MKSDQFPLYDQFLRYLLRFLVSLPCLCHFSPRRSLSSPARSDPPSPPPRQLGRSRGRKIRERPAPPASAPPSRAARCCCPATSGRPPGQMWDSYHQHHHYHHHHLVEQRQLDPSLGLARLLVVNNPAAVAAAGVRLFLKRVGAAQEQGSLQAVLRNQNL